MATDRELLKLADRGEREAALLEEKAAQLRERAAKLRALVAASALPSMQQQRSMLGSNMELQSTAPNKRVRIAAAKTDDDNAAKRALLEAGVTPTDVAKECGVGRSTVNAWTLGTRSIPLKYKAALSKPHGKRKAIPGSVWPKTGD